MSRIKFMASAVFVFLFLFVFSFESFAEQSSCQKTISKLKEKYRSDKENIEKDALEAYDWKNAFTENHEKFFDEVANNFNSAIAKIDAKKIKELSSGEATQLDGYLKLSLNALTPYKTESKNLFFQPSYRFESLSDKVPSGKKQHQVQIYTHVYQWKDGEVTFASCILVHKHGANAYPICKMFNKTTLVKLAQEGKLPEKTNSDEIKALLVGENPVNKGLSEFLVNELIKLDSLCIREIQDIDLSKVCKKRHELALEVLTLSSDSTQFYKDAARLYKIAKNIQEADAARTKNSEASSKQTATEQRLKEFKNISAICSGPDLIQIEQAKINDGATSSKNVTGKANTTKKSPLSTKTGSSVQ